MTAAPPPAAGVQRALETLAAVRDRKTATLLRTYANPLFRMAKLNVNRVHTDLPRDAAINSFGGSGNRMLSGPDRPVPVSSAVPGHSTGTASRHQNQKGY